MLAYTQSLPKLYDDWTLTVPLPEIDQPVGELDVRGARQGLRATASCTSTSHAIDGQRATATTRSSRTSARGRRSSATRSSCTSAIRAHDATVATPDRRRRPLPARARAGRCSTARRRAYTPRTWVILDDVSASRDAMERRRRRISSMRSCASSTRTTRSRVDRVRRHRAHEARARPACSTSIARALRDRARARGRRRCDRLRGRARRGDASCSPASRPTTR